MTADELTARLAHVSEQIELAESEIYRLQAERYALRPQLRLLSATPPPLESV